MAGKTWQEIAHALQMAPRALYDLRQEYELDRVLEQLVADSLESTVTGYAALVRKAAVRLGEMLDSDKTTDRKWAIDRVWPTKGEGGSIQLPSPINANGKVPERDQRRAPGELVQRAGAASKRLRSG